jgi:sigma-B regulation protein RsbU (phosphoserine phosphatase)
LDQQFRPIIHVSGPEGATQTVPLTSTSILVGRSAACFVQLVNPRVSRRHARLDCSDDGVWRVTHLGSDNGTFVDGLQLRSDQPTVIQSGSRLQIGPFTLALVIGAQASQPRLETGLDTVSLRGTALRVSDESKLIQTLAEIAPPKLGITQLHSLEEFGRKLLTIESAEQRLRALCRSILDQALGGNWAVVIGGDTLREGICHPLCPVERKGDSTEELPLSRSLITAARTRNEPVLATNAVRNPSTDNDALEMSISVGAESMAAVVIPLDDCDGQAFRMLYAAFPSEYGTGEWLALCALAARNFRQAEAAWNNLHTARRLAQIEAEVERARQVQQRLIPTECEIPGFDVAIRFTPCSGVAGDYVDALCLPDGRVLFVIADVVGKGIAAALVAVGVQTVVRVAVRRWTGLQDLSNLLDAHLVEMLKPGAFVTLIAMAIDPATGEVEAVNGGHPPAVVFSSSGGGVFREVAACGEIMFGPFPRSRQILRDRLGSQETLTLFTDGHFEVFNAQGTMLEVQGWCDLVSAAVIAATDSSRAADAVIDLTRRWQNHGQARDDQTLMVIRRSTPCSDA